MRSILRSLLLGWLIVPGALIAQDGDILRGRVKKLDVAGSTITLTSGDKDVKLLITPETRVGRASVDGTRKGTRAALILAFARVIRCPIAVSCTRKARAISGTVRPPTIRSVSATRASSASAG